MPVYRAKERGYAGGQIREAGETFPFSGKPGKWMESADGKAPAEGAAAPAKPAAPKTGKAPAGKGKQAKEKKPAATTPAPGPAVPEEDGEKTVE